MCALTIRAWLWCFICFFFSSRRRHTRWTGDWSSDVCSSDLAEFGVAAHWLYKVGKKGQADEEWLAWIRQLMDWQEDEADPREFMKAFRTDLFRSEERRVGKECRARWSRDHQKKKRRKTWRV